MKLIVGLGNPGNSFTKNRHNFGFIIINQIALDYEISFKEKFDSLYGSIQINNQKIHILKPQKFMNNSGESVAKAMNFFSLSSHDILIMHDEIELDLGTVKYKFSGSERGHNGLRSITSNIGQEYHRLRLGVGKPSHSEVAKYVLEDFRKDEYQTVEEIAKQVSLNLEKAIAEEKPEYLTENINT